MRVIIALVILWGLHTSLLAADIRGTVWNDANKNGAREKSEAALPNVQVDLQNFWGYVVAVSFTDAEGAYVFENAEEGQFRVAVRSPLNELVVIVHKKPKNRQAGQILMEAEGRSELFSTEGKKTVKIDAGLVFEDRKCPEPLRADIDSVWCAPKGGGTMVKIAAYGGVAYNGFSYGWSSQDADVRQQVYGQPVVAGPFPESNRIVSLTIRDSRNAYCSLRLQIESPGCSEQDSVESKENPGISERQNGKTTSEDKAFVCPELLHVFPNPAEDYLTVDLSEFQEKSVSLLLFDPVGRQTAQFSTAGGDLFFMPLTNEKPGFHWVQVQSDQCLLTERFEVKP